MQVSTIMTANPITVAPDSTLDEALARMEKKSVRHLPVVVDGEVIGVLSDRDLLGAMAGLPTRVHATHGHAEGLPTIVEEIMHIGVVDVAPEDSIAAAAVSLLHFGIGSLPVVSDGELVGILTESDILGAFTRGIIDAPMGDSGELHVSDQMTSSPLTIGWSTSMLEALDLCRTNGFRHLLVEEQERLVGIVSDRDLRRAAGQGRGDGTTVDEFLTKQPVTTSPDTTLFDAARVMLARKISCLPVLEDLSIVGILTVSDILDHCLDTCRDRNESAQHVAD